MLNAPPCWLFFIAIATAGFANRHATGQDDGLALFAATVRDAAGQPVLDATVWLVRDTHWPGDSPKRAADRTARLHSGGLLAALELLVTPISQRPRLIIGPIDALYWFPGDEGPR